MVGADGSASEPWMDGNGEAQIGRTSPKSRAMRGGLLEELGVQVVSAQDYGYTHKHSSSGKLAPQGFRFIQERWPFRDKEGEC